MKALLLLPLLMLASCGSKLNPSDYSFELTDKVTYSTLEKEDDTGEYASCDRDGQIAWELSVKPRDFTGLVATEGTARWGDYEWDDKKHYYFEVIDGKMRSIYFSAYGSWTDKERLKKVCAISDAKQFTYDLDQESVVMIPGVKTLREDNSSSAK